MIRVNDLSLRAGAFLLKNVSLTVPTGQYAVLMGRSGSGKTTILEALCGLRRLVTGRITLGARDVTRLPPAQRDIGYVPQDGAIFTSMTVRQNIEFGLVVRGVPRRRADERVNDLAGRLGVSHLLMRRAVGLSGGETQRVALARALAISPPVLLLDEPMSALDDQTRDQMHNLLESTCRHSGVTVLHVTHHAADAERLADVVLTLADGRVC